jgi:5'-nucleotidase
VLTVLPFQNTVATFKLTGAGIVEALENGVGRVEEGAGRFPQVAGMRYAWDAASEPGSRIKAVEVKAGDGWTALDMDKTYGVVTNNYMRGGGDGYKVFASKGTDAYDYGQGLEVIAADYIKANSPYTPVLRGNIVEGVSFGSAEAPKAEEPKAEEPKGADNMATMLYTIKKGDSLWSIASKNLGGGIKWKKIAELNKLTGSSILKVGSEIMLPK